MQVVTIYDNVLSNTAIFNLGKTTNAKATYQIFSLLYKYKFLNKKAFSAALGAGAGIMTQTRDILIIKVILLLRDK